jgi:hypothetical protein
MDCKCGGKFIDKKDTLILSIKLGLGTVAVVCDKCGAQRTVILHTTSFQDEEGVHDI